MGREPTFVNMILDIKPGQWFVADVIGKGIYEMVENGINHVGDIYAIVKCKKIFGQGFKHRNHETNCHPIKPMVWHQFKRLKRNGNG